MANRYEANFAVYRNGLSMVFEGFSNYDSRQQRLYDAHFHALGFKSQTRYICPVMALCNIEYGQLT
jgi:hypothetical protein